MIEHFINDIYVKSILIAAIIIFFGTLFYYLYLSFGLSHFRRYLISVYEENDPIIENRIVKVNNYMNSLDFISGFITPTFIKNSWKRFYEEYNSLDNQVIPDPYQYFNDDRIVHKAGLRKVIEAIPAIFVSLGILGTFWGITTGISGIETQEGSEGLQEGINTLLDGMKVAFYSSIVGIFISLVYQFLDRLFFYKILSISSDNFLYDLDKTIPIESESSMLDKIAKSQEEQLNDMRGFFTDVFIPQLTSGIADTVSETLNPHLEQSNKIMEKVTESTLDAQGDTLNEMVDHFIESLNKVTGDHIKDLGDALHKTVEWQEKVHNEMKDLVDELSNVAKQQAEMASNTTELSKQMNEYTETLSNYQEKLTGSTSELISITEKNTNLLEQMKTINKDMAERHQEEEIQFINRVTVMNESVEKIETLGSTIYSLQQEMENSMNNLTEASNGIRDHVENTQKLNESLIDQHELSNEWSVKTHEILEDIAHNSNISEAVQQNLNDLYKNITVERKSLDSMQSQYSSLIENSIYTLKKHWKENNEIFIENQDKLSGLNNALSKSMDDFAEHMHRGVQNTFEQFDTELNKAVGYLARGVSGIQTVVESMEQDMDSINGQISRFNQTLEKLNTQVNV